MKVFLFVSAVLVGITGIGTHADTQNYPWCSYYKNGGTNCGFITFDQCIANVSGIRGYCAQYAIRFLLLLCRVPARVLSAADIISTSTGWPADHASCGGRAHWARQRQDELLALEARRFRMPRSEVQLASSNA
jgi:hypothetical protein